MSRWSWVARGVLMSPASLCICHSPCGLAGWAGLSGTAPSPDFLRKQMTRKEKENNSRQSNYKCGKNGGIYLTLGIGKRSGQNPFSLCSEPMRILRTELSGFMLCLLKWNLRHDLGEAEFRIRRSDSQASTQGPCCVTLARFFQCFWALAPIPGKKKKGGVLIPIHTVSQGVSWKTNELMDLQEHDAIWGTIKTEMFMILPIVWFSLGLFLAWPESICERQTQRHAQTHKWNCFPVSSRVQCWIWRQKR